MYCICSDKSHDDIMKQQRLDPLPFDSMISTYTCCTEGCGSCLEDLRALFEMEYPMVHSTISVKD